MIVAHVIVVLILLVVLKSIVLRRDYFSPIGRYQYKGGWSLLLIVALLYILQATLVVYALPDELVFQAILLNLSHVGFTLLFLINRQLPGAKLAAVGLTLNLIVMLSNGGWMPITPKNIHDITPAWQVEVGTRPPSSKNIVLFREDTNLWFLSDAIRVNTPLRQSAMSAGDIVMLVGIALFFFRASEHTAVRDPTE